MKKLNMKIIASISVLVALAVVLKMYGFMIGTNMRISFYAIPLLVSGIIGGFAPGIVAALAADLIYGFFFNSYGYNPIYTVSALFWGVAGGLLNLQFKRKGNLSWIFVIIVVLITSLLETSNNAIWDFIIYGSGTTLVLFGYKLAAIGIKLPIIVFITKIINDRVVKVLFVQ